MTDGPHKDGPLYRYNPLASIRSLRDLRMLIPEPPPLVKKPKKALLGPWVPCALCGVTLKYALAVKRVIDTETYFAGVTHPIGDCDPAAVKAHRAWLDETSDRNAIAAEVLRKREAQARRSAEGR